MCIRDRTCRLLDINPLPCWAQTLFELAAEQTANAASKLALYGNGAVQTSLKNGRC